MGRFKYIPQELTKLTEAKAIKESDIWEINVKRKEEPTDIIDNTLVVYNDYKIPLNITEELAKETLDLRVKLDNLYTKMQNITKLLEETSVNYEIFEDRIFGKRKYIEGTNSFETDKYIYEPLKYEDDGYGSAVTAIDPYFEFEEQRLDYAVSCHEYNKYYIKKQETLINENRNSFDKINLIDESLNKFKDIYKPLKEIVSDDKFWENASKISYSKYIDLDTKIKKLNHITSYTVTCSKKEDKTDGDHNDI